MSMTQKAAETILLRAEHARDWLKLQAALSEHHLLEILIRRPHGDLLWSETRIDNTFALSKPLHDVLRNRLAEFGRVATGEPSEEFGVSDERPLTIDDANPFRGVLRAQPDCGNTWDVVEETRLFTRFVIRELKPEVARWIVAASHHCAYGEKFGEAPSKKLFDAQDAEITALKAERVQKHFALQDAEQDRDKARQDLRKCFGEAQQRNEDLATILSREPEGDLANVTLTTKVALLVERLHEQIADLQTQLRKAPAALSNGEMASPPNPG